MAREFIATTKPGSVRRELRGAAFARYYDLDVADELADIDMYLALASATDGPILELACGSGRVCVPLARAGHPVTGVDRDQHMLHRARGTWERLTSAAATAPSGQLQLVRGDITNIRLGPRFDLVILAFNSLLLLEGPAGRAAALATMHDHLTPDGRAVIDVWQPSADDLELYDGQVISDWTKLDPETGDRVTKSTRATYDAAARRATIRTIYEVEGVSDEPQRLERTDEISFVSRTELLAELGAAGLQVQSEIGQGDFPEGQSESNSLTVTAALSVHPFHTSRTN